MGIQSGINRINSNITNTLLTLKNNNITVPDGSNSDDLNTLLNTLLSQIVTVRTVNSKPSDNTGNNGDIFIVI